MGLFAPPAAYLLGWVGARGAVGLSLGLIAVFGVARALVPGTALVIAATFPVGIGMGLAGALLPVAVKQRFPDRPAFATGVYTTGIQLGSALSAAASVPLAGAVGGWRASLLTFSALTGCLVGAWLVLTRRGTGARPDWARPPRLPSRSGLARLLALLFGLMGLVYYGINSWLRLEELRSSRRFESRIPTGGWAPGRASRPSPQERTCAELEAVLPANSVP